MLQVIIQTISGYYKSGNRWWIPLLTGLLFPLCLPPFNHTTSMLLFPFPFLSFVVLIPLFVFATQSDFKRALVHTYLFSVIAALGQYYWIGFVTADGLWHLILIGLVLISAVMGLFYLIAGMLFRYTRKLLPQLYIVVFPAIWVLFDYARTLGEISFPWALPGYALTPILPLAQSASIWGVWGLTFLIVLGNILIMEVLQSHNQAANQFQKWIHAGVFVLAMGTLGLWGWHRMRQPVPTAAARIALLQNNIDQFHWGNNSLDSSFAIAESLVVSAAQHDPDLMIMPESALLCYLKRRQVYASRVAGWFDSVQIPILLGGLHWEKAPRGSPYEYLVYNSAFLIDSPSHDFKPYHKIKLVPFSEALPFEGVLPILSRVNLGEADFSRGSEETVFEIGSGIKAAPFICYEIIYPDFVRHRIAAGANLIVNMTNDGWFGRSSGPFQHAAMAAMRSIENGCSLARSANSGISMFVDPFGRVLSRTNLYERAVLEGTVPLVKMNTFYNRHGDWFISFCVAIVIACGGYDAVGLFRRRL